MKRLILWTLLAALPLSARAHLAAEGETGLWLVDPLAATVLLALAGLYCWGGRSARTRNTGSGRADRRRRWYFWAGWSTLVIALGPPLDPLGEQLFSAHMIQHELMMVVAAPLLVLSRPGSALLRGLPRPVARAFGAVTRGGRGFWLLLVSPAAAWTVHALGLWAWHLPALFEASLLYNWVHILQHLSFVLISLVFWFALFPHRPQSPGGVLYLFTTAVHMSLLAALLTFSPRIWYAPYSVTAPLWGLNPLQDQQLGGLIMWIPAGLVFIGAGLWSLSRVINRGEAEPRNVRRDDTAEVGNDA